MADTGSFRFSNTTASILRVGAELVALGAQPDVIARQLYETHSVAYLHLLQTVLATFTTSPDGKVAWIFITSAALDHAGVRKDETEGLVQYPRMIAGVEVALVFREISSAEVRVGFRSREYVDVSSIAREFGGGGHAKAAGCTIRATLLEACEIVVARVKEIVRQSS
jgi:phosphoesterase RecJ-like protein